MRASIIAALVVVCGTNLLSQGARPQLAFDVASVKPVADSTNGGGGWLPGGRFVMSQATLPTLIRMAYGLPDYRVVNASASWIDTDWFAVDARAPQIDGKTATREQVAQMLQALLADRFKLVTRRETRELPIYTLVFARGDRRPGPQLRQSAIDCSTVEGRNRALATLAKDHMVCGTTMGPTAAGLMSFTADGVQFSQLPALAAFLLQREITDRSGLSGLFDWTIRWAAEPTVDGPSFLTALEDQLGLKLEAGRGPVELLIIESAERPTPN